MDIVTAFEQVGTYRGAAALCGTTHRTVKRVVEASRAGGPLEPRRPRKLVRNTDVVREVIAEKVRATDGRISAKRLLPVGCAAGYEGSARNFRRAVAEAKAMWRRQRRVFRPWQPLPGEHLVIDWTTEGGWQVFCAVLAWSRWRFVRVARDQKAATTMRLLGECFEELGGVPKVVLADRMGCLKGGIVANVMVPTPDYGRFATHFGFRPDFCEAADPESKGVVEALCRYAQDDLIVPAGHWASGDDANDACRAWCVEVNTTEHSTIAAIPQARLDEERKLLRALPSLRPPLRPGVRRKVDKLATVRIGSARYSVPRELIGRDVDVVAAEGRVVIEHGGELAAQHPLVAPGEVSIIDEHYGGPRRGPARAVRPRSGSERAFLALGPTAERFLRDAAAAGTTKLGTELALIASLEAAWGRDALVAALERAVAFRRFKAGDVRSILEAGTGVVGVAEQGDPLTLDLPCSDSVAGCLPARGARMTAAKTPALPADLVDGLKRLKLAKVRAIAPEVLHTAKTQRWTPEEVLRTLVEAEIAARDDSNARSRLRVAGFPVAKTLDEFNVSLSSIPQATVDYLGSLEWVTAAENLCLVGPAGTGKSHVLIALGHAAVASGMRVRYFAAADLVETLYRGMADNTVAKIIDTLVRADLVIVDELGFAPLDLVGTQLLFRFVAAAYERRSLGIASHWPFDAWGRFLPEHTTAASMLDRLLHHAVVIVTEGDSYRMREAKTTGGRRSTKT